MFHLGCGIAFSHDFRADGIDVRDVFGRDFALLFFRTPAFREVTAGWQRRRHHWDIGEATVIPISSVVPALYTAVAAFTEPDVYKRQV